MTICTVNSGKNQNFLKSFYSGNNKRAFKIFIIQQIIVRSVAGIVVQLNGYSDLKCLALAVTSDGNIDQLGDGDDGDLSVQDDAEK